MARQNIQLGTVAFPIQNKFGKIQNGRDNIMVYIPVTFYTYNAGDLYRSY